MNDSSPLGIEAAFAGLLSRSKVMTPEEESLWQWRKEVVPRLAACGFDQRFHRELSLNGPQAAARAQCDALLIGCGAIVALVGIRGTGKTSIATAIAIERIRYWINWHGQPERELRGPVPRAIPRYFKAATLVGRYKSLHADYGSIDGPQLQESFERMPQDCGLLVIDEWHECDDQKMRDRVLVDLIDRFYSACKDVLIISNQEPRDFATKTNASILSRLDEHGKIISCKWKSFRTT